jgi:type I restriction enzyme S subunit
LRAREPQLDARYLFQWVKSSEFIDDMVRKATGASYPAVSDRIIFESAIPLPPLAEQRRIAEVLDRAEALRAKRRAALAELDALTQSLFLDLFGDPVTNPKWPEVMVSDFVAGFESGKSIVADDEDDTTSPYRVLKVSAVTSLEFRPEQSKAMPPDYSPPPSHFVRAGDLLFSRANTAELIGATAYVASTPPNLLLPDKLWRFVWHKTPKADPHFVRFLFQQPKFRREIGQRASGTSGSMKNISQEKVLTIKVGLPPIALQQEFARRVVAVEKLKQAQRAALAEQDALFATLQHRAFRGEL